MTTTLHDQLGDAVRDVVADPDALAARARRRAVALRRRRLAGRAALATVAASAVVAASWALLPALGGDGTQAPVATDPTAHAGPSTTASPSVESVRLTGRTTAALLLGLVGRQIPTTVVGDSVRGSGGVDYLDARGRVVLSADDLRETYAEARLVDGSLVQVNVQDLAGIGDAGRCSSLPLDRCHETTTTDGDLLVTYADDQVDKPGDVREVAAVFSPRRGIRVVVGSVVDAGTTQPMTSEQLAAVATDPLWGWRLPPEWADRGLALSSFTWSEVIAGTDARPREEVAGTDAGTGERD